MRPSGPVLPRCRSRRTACPEGQSRLDQAWCRRPLRLAVQRVLADGLQLFRPMPGLLGADAESRAYPGLRPERSRRTEVRRRCRPFGQVTVRPKGLSVRRFASLAGRVAAGPVARFGTFAAISGGGGVAAGARRRRIRRPAIHHGAAPSLAGQRVPSPSPKTGSRRPGWISPSRVGSAVSSPSHRDDRFPLARANTLNERGIKGIFWKAGYRCGPRCTFPVFPLQRVG